MPKARVARTRDHEVLRSDAQHFFGLKSDRYSSAGTSIDVFHHQMIGELHIRWPPEHRCDYIAEQLVELLDPHAYSDDEALDALVCSLKFEQSTK